MAISRAQMQKQVSTGGRKMKKKLVNEHGWLRVPWWIPGTNTHRLEGVVL